MSDDEFRYEVGRARDADQFVAAVDSFLERTAPPPSPAEVAEADSLAYTGRLGGGIMADIKRRLPYYISDFRDGLNTKSIAATLFLFFACLAPAVTFGGIMGVQTNGAIGVVEMLVATAVCGIIYSLTAGQPLIILGGLGQLLVFTGILFQICQDIEIPFLPAYAWVGIWAGIILVILGITDASYLMRYFTRFTDEVFSVLMSLIFIYEAIRAIVNIFRDSFVGTDVNHDSAFLSLILAIGTFYIAVNLSRIRRSKYLVPALRNFLADFGPMIALSSMTLVAWFYRSEVVTGTLNVPDHVQTTSGRPWLVDLWELPMWARIAAIGPAMLSVVLVYLTQNITGRLINSPDHNLRKGPAYHLDLSLVGILMAACSIFGLPWLAAATVRSLAHVRGLASIEEVVQRNGEVRERITHVNENRVTSLSIHVLIACSLMLLPTLKYVPLAVLYGIFLYMGVVSLAGNQFVERMTLWLMESGLYPSTHYTRRVPLKIIHKFTAIQFVCLAILCTITVYPLALVQLSFPLFIAALVFVQFWIQRRFSEEHLEALDADETPQEETSHWST